MLPPSGFGSSADERRERQVGDQRPRARRGRASMPRVATSASDAEQRQRPPGREPERERAALGEQQAEHRERDSAAATVASSAGAARRVERADRAHQREERGRHRARQRRRRPPARRRRPAGRAAARAARRAPKATPSANTSQPFASSATAPSAPNHRPAHAAGVAPALAHDAVEQPCARDRRHGRRPRPARAARPAAGTARCRRAGSGRRTSCCSRSRSRGPRRTRPGTCAPRGRAAAGSTGRRRCRRRPPRAAPPSAEERQDMAGHHPRLFFSRVRALPRRVARRPLLRTPGRGLRGGGRLRPAQRRRARERGRRGGALRRRRPRSAAGSATTRGAPGSSGGCARRASAWTGSRACRACGRRSRSSS